MRCAGKFIKYSETLQEYDNYIKNTIKENINKIFKENIIFTNELKKLDKFIQKNMLYYNLNNIYSNKDNIVKEKHIIDILKLIENKRPNITINLPQNKIVRKEYDKIYIDEKDKNNNNYKIEFNDNLNINNFIFKKINKIEKDDNSICRIDSSKIKLPLYFRNRKEGDFLILKGKNDKKKLKEIFIENKIPLKDRKIYPLLVDSNDNIIWIPNIKKSNFCIKKDEKDKSYDIIIKCN